MLVVAAFRDRGEEIGAELADALADLSRLDGVDAARARQSQRRRGRRVHPRLDGRGGEPPSSRRRSASSPTARRCCSASSGATCSRAARSRCPTAACACLGPVAELRGPQRIRDLVGQRLSRLGPGDDRRLLELAAVAGPRFELRVLAEAAGLEPAALTARAREATAIGMLEELPGPAPTCRFTHELVRRAVYDRITRLRRAELHLRVGEALEHAHADDPSRVLPELAHHFTLAAPVAGVERAVDVQPPRGRSGDRVGRLRRSGGEAVDRSGARNRRPTERARVQVELAYLLGETRRGSEADAMFAAGLEAATNLGERALAAHVLLQRTHSRLLRRSRRSTPRRRRPSRRRGSRRSGSSATNVSSRSLNAGSAWPFMRQGRVEEECAALERALVHADASGDRRARRMVIASLVSALFDGPTPVVDAIRRCEELLESSGSDRVLEAPSTEVSRRWSRWQAASTKRASSSATSSLVLDEPNL